MAPPARPGPAVGAVPTSGLVSLELTELYDYDVVRAQADATIYVVRPERTTLVLGSAQPTALLDDEHLG